MHKKHTSEKMNASISNDYNPDQSILGDLVIKGGRFKVK